jgi:hypothetical protein
MELCLSEENAALRGEGRDFAPLPRCRVASTGKTKSND